MPEKSRWASGVFLSILLFTSSRSFAQISGHVPANHNAHSAMAELQSEFKAAKPLTREELLGAWVAVKFVWTEEFLTRLTGPDRVEANEDGVRVSDRPIKSRAGRTGNPLEWRLTFRESGRTLQAISDAPNADVAEVRFEVSAFSFDKDYGGDSAWTYVCRGVNPDRLVCIFKGSGGHGVEFRRVKE